MLVRFWDEKEFLGELAQDSQVVERRIVRVAVRRVREGEPAGVTISLVATCVVAGRLVRFERKLGFVWHWEESAGAKIRQEAGEAREALAGRLTELGFDVRDGLHALGE